MTLQMLPILVLALFSLSNVLADDRHFYAFCPKNQSDVYRIDSPPSGEPATNSEFFERLKADGAASLSNSTNPANGGETTWWIAQVDADKVQKYKTFQLVRLNTCPSGNTTNVWNSLQSSPI